MKLNSGSPSAVTRRDFLKVAGAAAIVPRAAWAGSARPAASNRITMGIVGWGMMGPSNTKNFLAESDCQVVAACDLHKDHLQTAVDTINTHYGNQDCKAYRDFREMIGRDDIDAVMIAVPDQWHALLATAAANRKKDIYGEKPLARTVREQQAIVKAVEKNGIIWQTGSWQRSLPMFRHAAEIVRNGLIGNVQRVEVGLPGGHHDFPGTVPALMKKLASLPDKIASPADIVPGTPAWDLAVSAPPEELDFDRWLGPSKQEPYIEQRVYQNWRWNYNTGAGQLLDWIGHHGDIAHWGLDFDLSGPSEIDAFGEFPAPNAVWNTATTYRVDCKYRKEVTHYPNDVDLLIAGGHPAIAMGAKWIGTNGWVWVDRAGIDASNPAWIKGWVPGASKGDKLPDDLRKVSLYESPGHQRNFLDSVKSRKPTITPVETAHHSTLPGHLGLISMLVGRKLQWDVTNENILNDSGASDLLSRPYRAPWQLA